MKLLITASRQLTNEHYETLKATIEKHYPDATEILHGGAEGGDQLAACYANEKGLAERTIKPDYQKYPTKAAPLLRNSELVKLADATLAAYYGKPPKGQAGSGTQDAARKTLAAGKPLTELDALTGEAKNYAPALRLWN